MARRKSKDTLAMEKYGEDFEDLTGTEKGVITRKYNAQPAPATRSPAGTIKATIGRVGVNGTQTCLLPAGSKVSDLISQAGLSFDNKKEGVVKESTGGAVSLNATVIQNETYAITVEIRSA